MSANDNSDRLFWIAYCQLVQNQLQQSGSTTTGSNFFFSTKSQRGPPVNCPPAFTNFGIYNIANNLLSPQNLFYAPSAKSGYIDALAAYLNWVDLGGQNNDTVNLAILSAQQEFNAATNNLTTARTAAFTQYQQMSTMGMIPQGQTFLDWTNDNAPAYQNAVNRVTAASGALRSAQSSLTGPMAGTFQTDMQRIQNATTVMDREIAGITMPVTPATPPSMEDLRLAATGGPAIPNPTGIYYVPLYAAPDYAATVKSWQGSSGNPPTNANKFTLNLADAKHTSDSSFRSVKVGGDISFSYSPFLAFGANASSEHTETSLTTSDVTDSIEITMTWDDMKTATISPGNWNVSDPHANFPKLKTGAPLSAQYLARPAQMLLVSKLGYTVKFSGSVASSFDKKVTDTKSGGGYVRLFGLPISLGASGSSTDSTTSHVGTWNSASGEFTVVPQPDVGFATIIGMVGDIVQTF